MVWLLLIGAIVATAIYLLTIRPVVKAMPAFSEAFAAEASLWQKGQAIVTGWKTKIAARLSIIASLAVTLYDYVLPIASGQDWTPVTS